MTDNKLRLLHVRHSLLPYKNYVFASSKLRMLKFHRNSFVTSNSPNISKRLKTDHLIFFLLPQEKGEFANVKLRPPKSRSRASDL